MTVSQRGRELRVTIDTSNLSRHQALRNRATATHRFPVGAFVLHQVDRLRKETFRVTRLLPDSGTGLQYRIKSYREGFERVATDSSLEAIAVEPKRV
jgi:hypothetical protein